MSPRPAKGMLLADLAMILLLAPLFVVGMIAIGIWSLLLRVVEWATGQRIVGRRARTTYYPEFARFGQRPPI